MPGFDADRLRTWLFTIAILAIWALLSAALFAIPGMSKIAAFLLMCYPAIFVMGSFVGASFFQHRLFGVAHAGLGTALVIACAGIAGGPIAALGAAPLAGLGAWGGYALLRDAERREGQGKK